MFKKPNFTNDSILIENSLILRDDKGKIVMKMNDLLVLETRGPL